VEQGGYSSGIGGLDTGTEMGKRLKISGTVYTNKNTNFPLKSGLRGCYKLSYSGTMKRRFSKVIQLIDESFILMKML
jgi:hypothetical protein